MRLSVLHRLSQGLRRPAVTRHTATVPCAVHAQRRYSSSAPMVNVTMDSQRGVAVVELNRKPVNSLNLELNTELGITLEKLENDKSCRGYILTTSLPVFSAGLDILEMYKPDEARLRTFWKSFQDLVLRIHGSPLINIAAITGPAPAGGCGLSLSCDYRVMTDNKKAVIGLNESLIGIVAPYWLRELCQYAVGDRAADRLLQTGALLSPQEALAVGMVDEIVPQDQVIAAAQKQMDKWLTVNDTGRQLTKAAVRHRFISDLQTKRQEDEDQFVNLMTRDGIQKLLGRYLEAMKQKAAKK